LPPLKVQPSSPFWHLEGHLVTLFHPEKGAERPRVVQYISHPQRSLRAGIEISSVEVIVIAAFHPVQRLATTHLRGLCSSNGHRGIFCLPTLESTSFNIKGGRERGEAERTPMHHQ
jgi:hypothetical protein